MLLQTILRKTRQLGGDPVLRAWLAGRAFGRWPGEPAFTAHRPPYLDGLLPLTDEQPVADFNALSNAPPSSPITLSLAGAEIEVAPGGEEALFKRPFDDVETLLSLHRFAWMTAVDNIDPAWVQALWSAWRKAFGAPSDDWAWHPYTAGERASNILTFAHTHGLPGPLGDTLNVLAAHAPVIAARLEYFGDHHTSNHLANNGRGLYFLGCALGMEKSAAMGLRILLEEAQRIITASGMLREGSSHYHLLVLRLYENVAACAGPGAGELQAIANTMRKAAAALVLPGGLPLIGDISPDITPDRLLGDLALQAPETMIADGWLRFNNGPWSGLWHAASGGFSQMPGHGHQDMGSFELHYEKEPVIVDAGRGAYGETGEAALYRSAGVHNGLSIDGCDPYPPNRPYYDETFRRYIAGPEPELRTTPSGVSLRYRLNKIGDHFRQWHFAGDQLTINDDLAGSGGHNIARRLVSPLAAEINGDSVVLKGRSGSYRVTCDGTMAVLQPVTCWRAYGCGAAGNLIVFSARETLPFKGTLRVEAL